LIEYFLNKLRIDISEMKQKFDSTEEQRFFF